MFTGEGWGKSRRFPARSPGVWPLWVARGKSARLCRAGSGQGFGYRIEKSCLSPCLASEEGSTAPVLALARRLAWKKRRHFATPDSLVASLSTFIIKESFRSATALTDGFEQVAPGSHAMIGRIKHPPANERTAHQPKKIGALNDKGFDLDRHLATSS